VILAANTGWAIGYTIGIVIVLVVVALVVPILLLARRIGEQAAAVNSGLQSAVVNTAALEQLSTTIESAEVIVDGLNRGRKRLGG
jgi:cell division protein FtsB